MNELFSLQGFNNVIVCFLLWALESSHWWNSSGRRNVADAGIKRNQPQDTFGIEMILCGLWKCAMEKLFNSNRIQRTAEEDHGWWRIAGPVMVTGWVNWGGLVFSFYFFRLLFCLRILLLLLASTDNNTYTTEEMLQDPTMSSNPFVCQQRKSSSRSAILLLTISLPVILLWTLYQVRVQFPNVLLFSPTRNFSIHITQGYYVRSFP